MWRRRNRGNEAASLAISGLARSWRHLTPPECERLVEQATRLERTRDWEGLDGLEVTPGMRAVVCVRACVLTVNIGPGVFSDVTSILIAPTSSVKTTVHRIGGSLVSESPACVLGESMLHGPVRLAWDRVAAEEADPSAGSVILHEFAHKVDMADGDAGGTPPIAGRREAVEFEDAAREALDEVREEHSTVLRPYAATNRTELFAVATEAFFLDPHRLRSEHPRFYRVLAAFYRQDPSRRAGRR